MFVYAKCAAASTVFDALVKIIFTSYSAYTKSSHALSPIRIHSHLFSKLTPAAKLSQRTEMQSSFKL